MELDRDWVAIAADDELRRTFADPATDTGRWLPVRVPAHWRSHEPFAASDGPVLYRTTFDGVAPAPGRRHWLCFDGIFYQGDVWLDGGYLGDTEGYFAPHTFEVTEAMAAASEHTLAVEVTCHRQSDRTAKRNITGVFQHWDCFDPDFNPGGIWRPVSVVETGPVRITRLRTTCEEATAERAVLAFAAVLDAAAMPGSDARVVHLQTEVAGVDHEATHELAAGENLVEWRVAVDEPRLWWPHALGEPHLEAVTVRVVDEAGATSDERTFRTGLRQVRMAKWIASVNGERLFLKGSNNGPTRMALGEATAADCERDVQLAVDAGLDLLRLHAHVARPETYDAADRAGLLLWQDFPLQWGYSRTIRKQAVRQAEQMVDLLAHHPSIAIWCGHNEPMAIEFDPGSFTRRRDMVRVGVTALRSQQLPTWNKTILDRSVKRAIEKADGTRPVIAHSGVLPHLPQLDGTDSHLYFGWYWGDERGFAGFARAVPRMVRFVTEFGAQAVPHAADFCEPQRWPHLDWDRISDHHVLQKANLDKYVGPAETFATFDAWREATQRYQAQVTRHHVETLRRLKYRPTGGFAQFCFADGHPGVTWSVLDHERNPKLAYAELARACAPVIVVADRLPATVAAHTAIAIDVHLVSDLRTEVEGGVEATLSWTGGSHRWRFAGAVPADGVARIGTLQFEVPDAAGELTLHLAGEVGGRPVANEDRSVIEAR